MTRTLGYHVVVSKVAVPVDSRRIVFVDVDEIYYIEAVGGDTRIRTASRKLIPSLLRLKEWEDLLGDHGFLRVHRSYLVNIDRVRELRLRAGDNNDWELKLEPPVNKVLPVTRSVVGKLKTGVVFGGSGA